MNFDYIGYSLVLHTMVLLALVAPGCIKSGGGAASGGGEKIEVNIVSGKKFERQAPLLPTSAKPSIPGRGAGHSKKEPKFDMNDYGNKVKAVVDPIWWQHMNIFLAEHSGNFVCEVLFFPDSNGNITRMRLIKSSGNKSYDQIALQALREVGSIPKPPESLIKEGIVWEFSTGEGK